MELKLLFCVVLFTAAISMGAALKCYICAGTGLSDCARGRKASMAVQECDNMSRHYGNDSNSAIQQVCSQFYATDYQPKLFVRRCTVALASADPCTFLSKSIHLDGCKSCNTDLCNKRHQQGDNTMLQNNTV